MNKNLNGNVWNKASPRQTWTKYFIFVLSNLIKFHQPQITWRPARLLSWRGEGDIKHKYLKKSSTQFFTHWVKIAKCVFKQIPERVEYFVSPHDSIRVTLLSPGLKLELTLVPTFCSSIVRGRREERERRQQKIRSKSGFMSHVLRRSIVRLSEGMFDQERLSWTTNEEEILPEDNLFHRITYIFSTTISFYRDVVKSHQKSFSNRKSNILSLPCILKPGPCQEKLSRNHEIRS